MLPSRPSFRRLPGVLAVALAAQACAGDDAQDAPAAPGACHARGVTPAIIETVTEQVIEAPGADAPRGAPAEPARYRTVTSTRIVRPRGVNWFETPCPLREGDPDFIAQIQRALAARGLYDGPVSGDYDARTRAAVRAYQAPSGLESGTLSSASARELGLVALGREAAIREEP